ncbi:glycoside hydrolase family 3 protein [Nocardioides pyridinolyticus]
MSLERLALGVLLPAFPGTTLPGDWAELFDQGLGGVCLFGSNTAAGPHAVADLARSIRAIAPFAVIAVDEEGGDVTRLHALTGSPVLGPAALGAADDLELTRATGHAIGSELAAVGIDLDLGPVADVNTNPDNPVIGTRSFGTAPARVAEHIAAWVEGLQAAGAAGCAKHFPGHGDTAQDSHLELPTVDAPRATLEARELVPFGASVRAGVASVMTSHIVVPALDAELPATLSAPVLGLLREDLGHDGVIVTDALDMAGASAGRGIPEAAVLSLNAGADLLCIGADPGRPGRGRPAWRPRRTSRSARSRGACRPTASSHRGSPSPATGRWSFRCATPTAVPTSSPPGPRSWSSEGGRVPTTTYRRGSARTGTPGRGPWP